MLWRNHHEADEGFWREVLREDANVRSFRAVIAMRKVVEPRYGAGAAC